MSSLSGTFSVRRTGGFAGQSVEGSVDLAGVDPRATEVRELLGRTDIAATPPGSPSPDRFVYEFVHDGQSTLVHEDALTPDLRRLADLTLSR